MTLKQGDKLPDAMFGVMTAEGPELKSTAEIFRGHRVALFGLPGAYTPVCHRQHLPGIVALQPMLESHGIDTVACTAVNDVFVLDRWAKEVGARGKIVMLADGNGDFAGKERSRRRLERVRLRHPLEPLRHAGGRRRGEAPLRRGRADRTREVECLDAVLHDGASGLT